MQGLAGVFLQVGVVDAHLAGLAIFQLDVHQSRTNDGIIHLADLVTFGQVRIEVVLAVKDRTPGDLGVDGQAELGRHLDGALVEHRQHAGHRQVYGTGLGIGFGTKGDARPGENLGLGGQLHMHFQPDHDFPLHCVSLLVIVLLRPDRQVLSGASQSPAGSGARRLAAGPRRSSRRSVAGPRASRPPGPRG